MRRAVVAGIVAIVGCGHGSSPHLGGDGGEPDASLYGVSIDNADVTANAMLARTVTITGPAGDSVDVALDRASAGVLSASTVMLDPSGSATVSLTPCTDVTPGCIGPAMILVLSNTQPVASTGFQLVVPPEVGEVAPCQIADNILYLHGNGSLYDGQLTTAPDARWTVTPEPDEVRIGIGPFIGTIQTYRATFSLAGIAQPLAPGIYDQAQRAPAPAGHPGVDLGVANTACNQLDARFQVHDFTADPVTGAIDSFTISFEQVCDGTPTVLQGCVHYATTPTTPVTPPAPDPSMVSVQVLSSGAPDPAATAIFTSTTGTVVADTTVDMFGDAQAALPDGGELTVIQHANGYAYLHTYRGLHDGDHIVINPPAPTAGARDTMLATFTPPADATNVSVATACGGGSWAPSTGPVSAELAFYDGCRTPTFDALTLASIPNAPTQYVWQAAVPHHPYGNLIVPNTWAPLGLANVTLANIPAGSPSLAVHWSTKLDATPFEMASQREDTPAAGTHALSMPYAPGAGEGAVVRVDVFTSLLSSEVRTTAVDGAPDAVTVDFATPAVPIVSAIQQSALGASWTETPATADVRTLYWRATTASERVIWIVHEPADGQPHTQLPTLPAAHAADDPTIDPNAAPHGASITYDSYDTSGYRLVPPAGAFRAHTSTTETYDMQFAF